jgi:hypothetical protein
MASHLATDDVFQAVAAAPKKTNPPMTEAMLELEAGTVDATD